MSDKLRMIRRFAHIFLTVVLVSATAASAQTDYAKEIEKWRRERETNLKTETGWLTVAGVSWLKEGTNTVGAGEKFDVRLTENFKAGKFGEIDFANGKAVLKVANGVEAKSDGKEITGPIELGSDEKAKPT